MRNMIGKESKIISADGLMPKRERLVVGESTTICFQWLILTPGDRFFI